MGHLSGRVPARSIFFQITHFFRTLIFLVKNFIPLIFLEKIFIPLKFPFEKISHPLIFCRKKFTPLKPLNGKILDLTGCIAISPPDFQGFQVDFSIFQAFFRVFQYNFRLFSGFKCRYIYQYKVAQSKF